MSQTTINWKHTCVCSIIEATKCCWLSKCDVNGFYVEDNLFNVVRFTQFVVVVPIGSNRCVVEYCFSTDHVNTREELVACKSRCVNFFCINIGSACGVTCIFEERKFLQSDVVERNTLEAVIDSIPSIIVTLEFKVNVN